MPSTVTISSDYPDGIAANSADTKYIIAQGATVSSMYEYAIDASANAHGRVFEIEGRLTGANGLQLGNYNKLTAGGHIIVAATGSIDVYNSGIWAYGHDLVITNHGEITASTGISARGDDVTILNTGTITTSEDGVAFGGIGSELTNSGDIVAKYGVRLDGSYDVVSTFHNTGLVKGTDFAVLGYYGDDAVINDGKIVGIVGLSYGNDSYDGKGGFVHGLIEGEDGDDTLKGGARTDHLSGGAGHDLLTGRGAADVFVFASAFDKDEVTDFVAMGNGHDHIDLGGMKGFASFADLKGHMHEDGKDAVLDFGHGDVLTLHNVDFHDLSKADFLF